jgi:hypothetical protein
MSAAASGSEPLKAAEELLARVRAGRIVGLRQVRRLQEATEGLQDDDAVRRLRSFLRFACEELYVLEGADLVESVAEVIRSPRTRARTIPRLARIVRADRQFKKINDRLRRWYAEIARVPSAYVQGHDRAGTKVRAHRRLLGVEHLRDVRSSAADDTVAAVLTEIIAQARHYRSWPA